jgi:hypothetical protein
VGLIGFREPAAVFGDAPIDADVETVGQGLKSFFAAAQGFFVAGPMLWPICPAIVSSDIRAAGGTSSRSWEETFRQAMMLSRWGMGMAAKARRPSDLRPMVRSSIAPV